MVNNDSINQSNKKLHSDYQHNKRYLTTIRISCSLPTLTSYIKLNKKK